MSAKKPFYRSFLYLNCLALFSTLLFTALPGQAAIYRWVDKHGQVHYSAAPDPGNPTTKRVRIRQHTTTKLRIAKEAPGTKADAARKKLDIHRQTDKMPANEKRRLCQQARSDITSITSHGRMRGINAKGEYRYLSEKQRQQRLATARRKRQKFCQ